MASARSISAAFKISQLAVSLLDECRAFLRIGLCAAQSAGQFPRLLGSVPNSGLRGNARRQRQYVVGKIIGVAVHTANPTLIFAASG